MPTYLDAISARYFRGIGPTRQRIHPFSQINFFIGPNNSGKSTILNLISRYFAQRDRKGTISLSREEVYIGAKTGIAEIEISTIGNHAIERVVKQLTDSQRLNSRRLSNLKIIIKGLFEEDIFWATISDRNLRATALIDMENEDYFKIAPEQRWYDAWQLLTAQSSGSLLKHWGPETINWICNAVFSKQPPKALIIPAKRQLGDSGETLEDLSGRGLLDHLAEIQNPNFDQQDKKEQFKKINYFVRTVTGKPDATLEVPANRQHLIVHMDNKVLPLEALGTGIHETVLIAAFCTIHQNVMMCIEEPEVHLHPILQRKLINYLAENTDNQYFIATHSAALIDFPGASIFHVSNDGAETHITHVMGNDHRHALLEELGYRASDILQTNFVLWVEGPSDRIYLRHWISAKNPELVEGIHYVIMFYGGALLRHLSASDEAVNDFIAVLKLNRNCAIVMDSDKDSEAAALKPNVARIRDEMQAAGRMAWITAGREIENYVDYSTLQATLKNLHPRVYDSPHDGGRYDHAFYFLKKPQNEGKRREAYKEADKVGAARAICDDAPDFSILDLGDRITELVALIEKANSN